MNKLLIILSFLFSFQLIAQESQQPLKYHGIIIGINDYDHWGDLRRAKKDAVALEEILRDKYNFESITSLYDENANAQSVEKVLRQVIPDLSDQDALLVYFSGHGYYDELLDQGFWIPSDARVEQNGQPAVRDWIENDRIKQYLEKCKARHVLVVSDACFSGALFKGGFTELNPTTKSWYKHAVDQPSRWAITSGDMEMVPDASVFGMKLLQLLKFPPREVFSVSDLVGWLKKEVSAFDGTLPVAGPLHDPQHKMGGEFIFVENGIEADFWSEETVLSESRQTSPQVGRIKCYSNMDSQVYINGQWVGFVEQGDSILIDSVSPGPNELSVKSEFGLFQKTLDVVAGQVANVNAVFFDGANQLSHRASLKKEGLGFTLNMDKEFDQRLAGLLENNGVYVTRDAIRGNALRFQHRGSMVYRSTQFDDFGSEEFSIGLWFKWLGDKDEDSVLVHKLHPTHSWGISINGGHLQAAVSSYGIEHSGSEELRSPVELKYDVWYHAVFQRTGNGLSLWLNGELQDTFSYTKPWDCSNTGPIMIGFNGLHHAYYYTGVIDEISFLKRSRSEQEIRSDYLLKFEKFRVTRKLYSERDDLDLIAKRLYGASARLADWQEVVSRFSDDLDELWNHLGLEREEKVWMTYLNRRFYNSARHFYAFKTDSAESVDDEIHQETATNEGDLVLSSWINMSLPMLIEM